MSRSKLLVLAVIIIMVMAFFAFDAGRYLNFVYFKAQHETFATYYRSHPLAAALAFFFAYVAVTGLSLLGVFPLVAKKIVDVFKARRVYAKWRKPSRFDRNLVVIGAGSAGLVASYIGAAVKARVTLVEKHRIGGDCLNTGCVPSKALIKTARVLAQFRRARDYGWPEPRRVACRSPRMIDAGIWRFLIV